MQVFTSGNQASCQFEQMVLIKQMIELMYKVRGDSLCNNKNWLRLSLCPKIKIRNTPKLIWVVFLQAHLLDARKRDKPMQYWLTQ